MPTINSIVEVDLRLHCESSGEVECETSSLLRVWCRGVRMIKVDWALHCE